MIEDYKLFVFEKVKSKSYYTLLIYLLINIFPIYFLNLEYLFVFIILISFTSFTIFMGSDYLKSTRNLNLFILWIIIYIAIYAIQLHLIGLKIKSNNSEFDFIRKIIRFPLIGIIYSQIFRVIFIKIYKYEPSMYWKDDYIGKKIFSKNTYHKEDYIWFFIGRFIMVMLILFINLILF